MRSLLRLLVCLSISAFCFAKPLSMYRADNSYLHYVGRVDLTNKHIPRFWNPGVYVQARFKGNKVEVALNDEVQYGKNHNYIEIAIDDRKPFRVQTTGKASTFKVDSLGQGTHTITVCKDTESGIGYLEMVSISCEKLLPWVRSTKRKIEFIGNSITCGTGSDLSKVACDKGEWYDQHNAYMSYAARTARMLNSEWQLTAVSGIGLIHSCCDMDLVMPQVFDKINLRANSREWNFKNYVPDVVTVCLGQNDGKQDSTIFCNAYIQFIKTIRSKYPYAAIVLLNSPMADGVFTMILKKNILAIESTFDKTANVHHFFFSRRFSNGCGGHPDMAEHQLIAVELSAYLRQLKHWQKLY